MKSIHILEIENFFFIILFSLRQSFPDRYIFCFQFYCTATGNSSASVFSSCCVLQQDRSCGEKKTFCSLFHSFPLWNRCTGKLVQEFPCFTSWISNLVSNELRKEEFLLKDLLCCIGKILLRIIYYLLVLPHLFLVFCQSIFYSYVKTFKFLNLWLKSILQYGCLIRG